MIIYIDTYLNIRLSIFYTQIMESPKDHEEVQNYMQKQRAFIHVCTWTLCVSDTVVRSESLKLSWGGIFVVVVVVCLLVCLFVCFITAEVDF